MTFLNLEISKKPHISIVTAATGLTVSENDLPTTHLLSFPHEENIKTQIKSEIYITFSVLTAIVGALA